MRLFITGIDFSKRPAEFGALVRDDEGVMAAKADRALKRITGSPVISLHTCDRFEVYSIDRPVVPERLLRVLSLNPLRFTQNTYSLDGDDATEHLFYLSTGFLSPLFGEETIGGQLGRALEIARKIGTSSSWLSKLFSVAIMLGKKARSLKVFSSLDEELVSLAVGRVEEYRSVMIIGSSREAREIAERLVKRGRDVTMTLRDKEKDFLVPPGVKRVGYYERMEYVSHFPVVISSTKGLYETLSEKDASYLEGKLLIDLSYPYDISSSLSPLRPKDLGYRGIKRAEAVEALGPMIREARAIFSRWEEERARESRIASLAEDSASNLIWRISKSILSLPLGDKEKTELLEAIRSSAERAVIKASHEKWGSEELEEV